MSKLKIEKSASVTTTACTVSLSVAELCTALGIQNDADVTIVSANGGQLLTDERVVIQFEKRDTRKPRAKREAK